MIVIIRQDRNEAPPAEATVLLSRPTPDYADAAGGVDHFCDEATDRVEALEQTGHRVVRLRDGWYEAGAGGVAIWGNGRYFELRDTPFTVSRPPERAR